MRPAPAIIAEAAVERLVIKEGRLFVCCRPNGDILPGFGGDGLYFDDTRYLSELRMDLSEKYPILLSSSDDLGYALAASLTNPEITSGGDTIPQQTLSITRFRFVESHLHEQITVTNYARIPAEVEFKLLLKADFADTFEVRRVTEREMRGELLEPRSTNGEVSFGYRGEDDVFRETSVRFKPKAEVNLLSDQEVALTWRLRLAPETPHTLELTVTPVAGNGSKRAGRATFHRSLEKVTRDHEQWIGAGTEIVCDNEEFAEVLQASVRDLKALITPIEQGEVIAAGIPWYVAPFGRDSVIASYESLLFNTAPARSTLLFLADHQSKTDDPSRDAEPGKILHEIRYGELARAHLIPHTPYYGSVDSTPLFIMLCAAYYRWTHDEETMARLLPSISAGLEWIRDHGDVDGDGFLEYQTRSDVGLANQGWKDSADAVVHLDGQVAEGPIALAEVQGYVYLAKLRIAEVLRELGEGARSDDLEKEARALREAFNDLFWNSAEGFFALALDGEKKPVNAIASNPGHGLYCGIIDEEKAGPLVERLMAPDMFSGWGIRTLSRDFPSYNPMSYHNGSVWPHDNAIIAAGMKRYGFHDETDRIATAMFDAARISKNRRLPELYCGFDRREGLPYVQYPVACSPQAWSAAAPLMLLQAMLGISARAPDGVLTINKPRLPSWLRRVELTRLRVGKGSLSIAFGRDREKTSVALLDREGDIRLSVEA